MIILIKEEGKTTNVQVNGYKKDITTSLNTKESTMLKRSHTEIDHDKTHKFH